MKVLLVDDDVELLDVLTYALRRNGCTVLIATDGRRALECHDAEQPDVVVVEAKLPRLNGFEVCRRIRLTSDTPVVMMSDNGEETSMLRSLKLGADDYIVKPFSFRQLVARIEAILRRYPTLLHRALEKVIRVGDLVLDPQTHEVTKAGEPIHLTPTEFRILYLLALNHGQITPYSSLMEYAWGDASDSSSMLKAHVTRIRKKLNLPADQHDGIRAVLCVGYSLGRSHALPASRPSSIPARSDDSQGPGGSPVSLSQATPSICRR